MKTYFICVVLSLFILSCSHEKKVQKLPMQTSSILDSSLLKKHLQFLNQYEYSTRFRNPNTELLKLFLQNDSLSKQRINTLLQDEINHNYDAIHYDSLILNIIHEPHLSTYFSKYPNDKIEVFEITYAAAFSDKRYFMRLMKHDSLYTFTRKSFILKSECKIYGSSQLNAECISELEVDSFNVSDEIWRKVSNLSYQTDFYSLPRRLKWSGYCDGEFITLNYKGQRTIKYGTASAHKSYLEKSAHKIYRDCYESEATSKICDYFFKLKKEE